MKTNKWLIKALVLGAVFFVAAFFVKPVGVSTQYSVLSGIVHSKVDPGVITKDENRESGYKSSNAYYDRHEGKLANKIEHPWDYDFVFVLAIPAGAFIVYAFTKNRKKGDKTVTPDIPELPVEQPGFIKTYLPSFAGGFILLYGARMADGCTSGHMMSGMMQSAVSGYFFAAAVFVVAIPTAIVVGLLYKNRGGR